jgi:hypothetical protein
MLAGFFAVGGKPSGSFHMIRSVIWAELHMATAVNEWAARPALRQRFSTASR